MVLMWKYLLIIIIVTPWLWNLAFSTDFLKADLNSDISIAREQVVWERGKLPQSYLNYIFSNWPSTFINQRVEVVMENLDIGNYFFAGHPRERTGVKETQKFFIFQFVLFLIGFFSPKLKKIYMSLLIYMLVVFIGVFLFKWRGPFETLPLSLPFIVLMALGLEKFMTFRNSWKLTFFLISLLEVLMFLYLTRVS